MALREARLTPPYRVGDMRKWIFILLAICFFGCNGQQKDCSYFRTGKFRYVLKNRPEIVIRTDSKQVEINPLTKVEVHSSIEWKSDCEYVMTYEAILNYPEDGSHLIGQKINVKIISTDSKGYKVHATSPRIDNVLEFKIAE